MPNEPCIVNFAKDNRLDKWKGIVTPGIIKKTCTDAQLDKYAINFQCGDEQYRISLR